MASPNTGDTALRTQACDNCRFRKTKCDRGSPCSSCVASSVCCQYLRTPRRRGARKGQGKRLVQIRQGLDKSDGRLEANTPWQIDGDGLELEDHPPLPEAASLIPAASSPSSKRAEKQLILALTANVQLFMKHLLPILPVLNEAETLADVQRFSELSLPRQSLILSLCAATRFQLKLDHVSDADTAETGINTYLHSALNDRGLFAAAKRLRRGFDISDNLSVDAIMTSFFLFAAHADLEEFPQASFYLNESISIALSLGLDNEVTYLTVPHAEREIQRRIYWLLFVTERTYALQHRRPVMLRSTILKPQVVDSEYPSLVNDFVNHIQLFELLPHALYDWSPNADALGQHSSTVMLSQRVADMLSLIRPGESVLESQRLDTLLTQQWLRVSMWRLAYGQNVRPIGWQSQSQSLGIPFDAGRSIMSELGVASQSSKDCHGIAIEQKLFDLGINLIDVSKVIAPTSSFELGPVDLLYSIVNSLGHIRGRTSPLLPKLLNYCGGVLPFEAPAPRSLMGPTSYQDFSVKNTDMMAGGEALLMQDAVADDQWCPEDCNIALFRDMSEFTTLTCETMADGAVAGTENGCQ